MAGISIPEIVFLCTSISCLLLFMTFLLVFVICKRVKSDPLSEPCYNENDFYHIPRPSPARRQHRRAPAVVDTSVTLTLPPAYAYVLRNSDEFPELLLEDPIEIPPPTYDEVMMMLGTRHM